MMRLKYNKKSFKKALTVLKSGGVVAVPTETVYGFSCDPLNLQAIKKIYQIKGRNYNKPLLLIADSIQTVKRFFVLHKKEKELTEKYWPGPLTIILTLKHFNTLALKKIARDDKIAIRVSGDRDMRLIAKSCGGLITSTSANLSGQRECRNGREVYQRFKKRKYQPDLILDRGRLLNKLPSTIVKMNKNKIKVLRQGDIVVKQ